VINRSDTTPYLCYAVASCKNIVFNNCIADAEGSATGGSGFHVETTAGELQTENIEFNNCIAYKCVAKGWDLSPGTGEIIQFITLNNCIAHTTTSFDGFYAKQSEDLIFNNCEAYSAGQHGFFIYNSKRVALVNCVSRENTKHGIELDTVDGFAIIAPIISKNKRIGIWVYRSGNGNVVGGVIKNNSTESAGTFDGIKLQDSTKVIVASNRLYDDQATKTQNYGILESGTSDYNLIHGNISPAGDHVTGGITTVGLNTVTPDNIT